MTRRSRRPCSCSSRRPRSLSKGSGALPLAVLEQIRKKIRGKKVVVIISGGNIDVNVLSRIIDRGLIRAGQTRAGQRPDV